MHATARHRRLLRAYSYKLQQTTNTAIDDRMM